MKSIYQIGKLEEEKEIYKTHFGTNKKKISNMLIVAHHIKN